jgi:hypothetical protein
MEESFLLLRLFEFGMNYEAGIWRFYYIPCMKISHPSRKTEPITGLIDSVFPHWWKVISAQLEELSRRSRSGSLSQEEQRLPPEKKNEHFKSEIREFCYTL